MNNDSLTPNNTDSNDISSKGIISNNVLPPLSLYIHTPWCIKKCPYCDFNSHAAKSGDLPTQQYLDALINDFEHDSKWFQGRPIHTVFIGGGTPSLLSADFYQQLFSRLKEFADFDQCQEITLEANPSTFEQEKFIQYRKAGINRLSIGIQSFNQSHLQRLGRIHSADEAKVAIEIAQQANFDSFNLDLMHGLPGQSIADAINDLEIALSYQPKHLSWYQLTIEPNTVFHTQKPILPIEDTLYDIQEQGKILLESKGFKQYEVSAYSRHTESNNQCSHNLNYWRYGDYIGIGAGAHGKLTLIENDLIEVIRTNKTRAPQDYINAFSDTDRKGRKIKRIDKKEYPFEFLMNTLRINEGFTSELFSTRTGLPFSHIENKIDTLVQENLMVKEGTTIRTSELGARFLNSVLERFL